MCAGLMVKENKRKRIQREGAKAIRGSENEQNLRLKRTREKTWQRQFLFFSKISTSYLIEKINYLNFIKSNLLNYLN